MKYSVEIIEKLSMLVEVEASSADEALKQVAKKYWNEEIVVESSKRADVEFLVTPVEGASGGFFRKLFKLHI